MKKQFTGLLGRCCALAFFILIGITGAKAQYCPSASTSTIDEFVSGFSYGSFVNTSIRGNYQDFTNLGSIGVIAPGIETSVNITVSNPFAADNIFIYIDSDGDDNFSPADLVGSVLGIPTTPNPVTINVPITVPAGAVGGETRLRVKFIFNNEENTPCQATFTFGEVEDYIITIEEGDCTPPAFVYNSVDDCEGQSYDVTATINAFGDAPFVTIFLTRSDDVDVDPVTIPNIPALVGQTIDIIENVPFGVTVTALIQGGSEPICDQNRTFQEVGFCPPPNPTCETAIALECGDLVSGSIENSESALTCGFSSTQLGVWYTISVDETSFVELETCLEGTNFDTNLSVYTGTCGNLNCFSGFGAAGYNDGPSACSVVGFAAGGPDASFNAAPGTTYYIFLSGFPFQTFDYALSVTCTPILCELPEITATPQDANGNEITGCVQDPGSQVFVLVELGDADGNDQFAITPTVGFNVQPTQNVAAGGSLLFGPYAPGTTITFEGVGVQDPLCDANALVTTTVCPPLNDLCADAIPLVCGAGNVFGSTLGATADNTCNFNSTSLGVWYTINVDEFTNIQIESCNPGTNFDTNFSLFTGSCGDLTCFSGYSGDGFVDGPSACPVVGFAAGGAESNFSAEAGVTYYLLVTGFGQGIFELSTVCTPITCVNPTVTATPVDANGDEFDGCIAFDTQVFVELALSGGSGNATYTVTPSILFNTLPAQTVNAGSTTTFGPYAAGSVINFNVVGNTQAFCSVTTSAVGTVCPPVNDLCANALPAVCGGSYAGSTIGATSVAGQSYCGTPAPDPTNGGVWYSFSTALDAQVTMSLAGSNYDSKLFLYSGSCDNLTCVTGDDDSAGNVNSLINIALTGGTQYYVYVTGYNIARGTYNLNISCVNAACSPTVTAVAVADAAGNPINGCVPQTDNYFVQVTLSGGTSNDFYNVSINGGAPTLVAANGTAILGPVSSLVTANVSAVGQDVLSCSGTATTSVTICPPTNDLCADAIALDCNSTVLGSNFASTGDLTCSFGSTSNGVWYTINVDEFSFVELETCNPGTNFDTNFSLFTGSCGNLTCYTPFSGDGFVDGALSCPVIGFAAGGAEASFSAEVGVTYYLLVSGFGTGTFELSSTCTPITCENPTATAVVVDANGTPITECITDVTTDVFVDLTLTGGSGNAAYNVTPTIGFSTQPTVLVDPNTTETFGPYNPGDIISFNIVGIDQAVCNLAVTASTTVCPPDNDVCEDAIVLECGDLVSGTTLGSTATGDFCGFGSDTQGVWYVYTATGNGTATIETCLDGTNYDTDSHVFTGSCDNLSCYEGYGGTGYVDGASACTFAGFATGGDFPIVAGETYYILINGYFGATGNFSLSLDCEFDDTINLNGTVSINANCGESDVTINLYTPGTSTLVASFDAVVATDGSFTVAVPATGTYDVIVKVDNYLAKGFQDVVVGNGDNALAVGTVVAGDINNDNSINGADFGPFAGAYFTVTGGANFLPAADLNCDGQVNGADFGILSGNYFNTGASAPLN